MKTTTINTPVTISALRFGKGMSTWPCRMEWNGRTIHFRGAGIRVQTNSNAIITVCDDVVHYSLRYRLGNWTLLSVMH